MYWWPLYYIWIGCFHFFFLNEPITVVLNSLWTSLPDLCASLFQWGSFYWVLTLELFTSVFDVGAIHPPGVVASVSRWWHHGGHWINFLGLYFVRHLSPCMCWILIWPGPSGDADGLLNGWVYTAWDVECSYPGLTKHYSPRIECQSSYQLSREFATVRKWDSVRTATQNEAWLLCVGARLLMEARNEAWVGWYCI